MINVLVAYATKHQSTAEIASMIGCVLTEFDELNVEVAEAGSIRSVMPYDAIILGSAVYIGTWQVDAVNFLKRFHDYLANAPLWLFSSGPTGYGDPVSLLEGWHYPDALEALISEVKPRAVAVFHGKLNPDDLSYIEKRAIKMVDSPFGDFRDWNMICEWAEAIGRELVGELVTT